MADFQDVVNAIKGQREISDKSKREADEKKNVAEQSRIDKLKKSVEQVSANIKKGDGKKTKRAKKALEDKEKQIVLLETKQADNQARSVTDSAQLIQLKDSKEALKIIGSKIEAQGGVASENAEYNKMDLDIKQKEFDLRIKNADNKGAKGEIEKERRAAIAKQGTLLQKISSGIMGIGANMKDKALAAGKGLGAILKGTLFAGLFLALAMFFQSPLFGKMIDFISKTLIPKLQFFYDGFFGPKGGFIEGFSRLFGDIDGIGGIVLGITGVALLIAGFKIVKIFKAIRVGVLATKAFLLMTGTKLNNLFGPKGKLMAGIAAGFGLIGKALLAIKVFFSATLLPAITGILVPLLPFIIIIGLIVAAGYAIYNSFKAFQKRMEETGSIVEAIKAAFSTFLGTIFGLLPMLLQKLIVFVAELFGFDDFAKTLGNIDVIGEISTAIEKVIDYVIDFFVGLPDKISAFFTKYIGPDAQWAKDLSQSFTDFFAPIINFDFSALLGDLLGKAGKIGKKIANFFGFGDKSGDEELAEIYKKQANARALGLSNNDKMMLKAREMELKGVKSDSENTTGTSNGSFLGNLFGSSGRGSSVGNNIDQMNKSALAKSSGGGQGTIINNAPNVKTSTNNTNTTVSSTQFVGQTDPVLKSAMSFDF